MSILRANRSSTRPTAPFLVQDGVTVVGYPIGGDTISVTSGVVSRIEVTSYVHGSSELLGVQIDAAINSGVLTSSHLFVASMSSALEVVDDYVETDKQRNRFSVFQMTLRTCFEVKRLTLQLQNN
jgi:hypothetical protein